MENRVVVGLWAFVFERANRPRILPDYTDKPCFDLCVKISEIRGVFPDSGALSFA
jgi:hypothetical protein